MLPIMPALHRQAFAVRELKQLLVLGSSSDDDEEEKDERGKPRGKSKKPDDDDEGTTTPEGTSKGPRVGTCPIPGCIWATLMANHPYYRAGCNKKYVHNLCAQQQGSNLCDSDNELNMYC
jgi:hypothetical protein